MAKIIVNNPKQVINGGAKKYYFKVKGLGGLKGDKGDKGEKGDTGPQGPAGKDGATGATGPQGPQGEQGPQGPAGADGKSFTPVVVSSLPTTGTEGKLYLTPKNYTTVTATGNPITISLGEDAGQITSFQLDGDTFQQSYTGKNLFNKDNVVNGIPSRTDGSIISTSSLGRTSDYIPVVSSTAYSHTGHSGGWAVIAWYKSDKSFIKRTDNVTTTTSPSEAAYARVSCAESDLGTCQFEIGQPTAYEPYVGGTPSPNPDYPQPIQTVTDEQTITINGTDYHLNLGNIELCKLGEYQDYIWKDGDDWKVHKATNRAELGDKDWVNFKNVVIYNSNASKDFGIVNLGDPTLALVSNMFTASKNSSYTWRCYYNGENNHLNLYGDSAFNHMSSSDAKQWLSSKNAELLCALATPTDTVITDQTLIAQLEAIRNASLQNGVNNITNIAIAPNLTGDMEIGYYGYKPHNRYDKWLWLDIDNEYEQIGS